MKVGVRLPQYGVPNAVRRILAVAQRAETLGFDSVWVGDHIALPASYISRYPFTPDGRLPLPADSAFLDPFVALSLVAAGTDRVGLGISACVAGHRPTAMTVKLALSVHALSGHRLILGVAAGWMQEEFAVVGAEFNRRRERAADLLRVMAALRFAPDEPVRLPDHDQPVFLRPAPPPDRPLEIWTTGKSKSALELTVAFGDGWHPHLLDGRPDRLRSILQTMVERTKVAGVRQPGHACVSLNPYVPVRMTSDREPLVVDPWRVGVVVGGPRAIAELLHGYQDVGAQHLVVRVADHRFDDLDALDRFKGDVVARL